MPPKRRAQTPLERHEICKRRLEPRNAKKTPIEFDKLFPNKQVGNIETLAYLGKLLMIINWRREYRYRHQLYQTF